MLIKSNIAIHFYISSNFIREKLEFPSEIFSIFLWNSVEIEKSTLPVEC